jgi:hypothetical protein
MQPEQIPQVQIPPQNIQIPIANQPVQPQFYQVIQTESPNTCEKCSKFFTGSTNIPIMVFTILMTSFLFFIFCCLALERFFGGYFVYSSFYDLIFALFVWSRMALKIETNTSTVKYGYLFLVNLLILSLITLSFPLARIWNFVLFETILIALNNRQKKIKFFCCRISGSAVIVLSVIYHAIFNWFNILSIIITIIYAACYNKYLSQRLNISNERVERIENWCIINYLKNKFKTFITLGEAMNKDKKQQPLVQDINNSVNMTFIPVNMYPNYYSGIISNPQQQIPLQQIPQAQGAMNPPVVDINQTN